MWCPWDFYDCVILVAPLSRIHGFQLHGKDAEKISMAMRKDDSTDLCTCGPQWLKEGCRKAELRVLRSFVTWQREPFVPGWFGCWLVLLANGAMMGYGACGLGPIRTQDLGVQ